jgi:hypothetical protein
MLCTYQLLMWAMDSAWYILQKLEVPHDVRAGVNRRSGVRAAQTSEARV